MCPNIWLTRRRKFKHEIGLLSLSIIFKKGYSVKIIFSALRDTQINDFLTGIIITYLFWLSFTQYREAEYGVKLHYFHFSSLFNNYTFSTTQIIHNLNLNDVKTQSTRQRQHEGSDVPAFMSMGGNSWWDDVTHGCDVILQCKQWELKYFFTLKKNASKVFGTNIFDYTGV